MVTLSTCVVSRDDNRINPILLNFGTASVVNKFIADLLQRNRFVIMTRGQEVVWSATSDT